MRHNSADTNVGERLSVGELIIDERIILNEDKKAEDESPSKWLSHAGIESIQGKTQVPQG